MWLNGDFVFAMGHDLLRHTASGYNFHWLIAERGQNVADNAVDHCRCAVNNAALHTLDGVAADNVFWLLDIDSGELRSPGGERA